jgi:hypothetical protein
MASFVTGVLNLSLSHSKDVKYVDCVQQYFSAGKQQRAYCPTCAVVAGFVHAYHHTPQRCCLWIAPKQVDLVK